MSMPFQQAHTYIASQQMQTRRVTVYTVQASKHEGEKTKKILRETAL